MTPVAYHFTLFVLSTSCDMGLIGLLTVSIFEGRAGGAR